MRPLIDRILTWAAWLCIGSALIGVGVMRMQYLSLSNQLHATEAAYATEKAQAATAARMRLEDAARRSDAVERQFITVKNQLNLALKERQNEIKNASTGHQCLNADLVGVLNHTSAYPHSSSLPTATGEPITASTATAAIGANGLSDADVATWINTAQAQHNECRAQVQALIDWVGEGSK